MDSSGWFFYASVILNIALLVALFFRTALNDVVRDWWEERRRRHKEEADLLHKLHHHLSLYPTYHFSTMVSLFIMSTARTPEEVSRIKRGMEKTGNVLQQFIDFTSANELRFSEEIRAGLRKLREEASVMDVLEGQYARMYEISERVVEICVRLKGMIEQELKRF